MEINLNFLESTFPKGKIVSYNEKKIIAHPHQRVEKFYWLISGQLTYYIPLNQSKKEIQVSKISRPFMPVGWGGFNSPHRFGLKIIATKNSKFFCVDMKDLLTYTLSQHNPLLIKNISESLYFQMYESVKTQLKKLTTPTLTKEESPDHENYFISPDATQDEVVAFLRKSPFLSELEETDLRDIALYTERREFERGELLTEQDYPTGGFYALIQGEVAIRRTEQDKQLNMRSISTPGFVFGWSSLLDKEDIFDTITTTKTSVYFIDKAKLEDALLKNEDLSTRFYFRLVWLIGNQLNMSFIRYLNLRLNHDVLSVQNLIANSKSKLTLSSGLHQIQHLLKVLETKPRALEILHQLNREGNSLERHISSISLDLLKKEAKEVKFVQGLRNIYEEVAERNQDKNPTQIRIACAEATNALFQDLNYHMIGLQNLPKDSGHIFIYNHLLNPPYYTLENNFQITLDSHFISAKVLYETYGEPGIRTVRIGKGEEYGHQNYYERLGYINVYTKDSDNVSEEEKESSRDSFYRQANEFLDNGYNLIISPEGTSFTTEESPGPFKTGAFRLALQRNKPTLIVPIVIANFDKRIPWNSFYCKILPPIDLHKQNVQNSNLYPFIDTLRETYIKEIKEARETLEN